MIKSPTFDKLMGGNVHISLKKVKIFLRKIKINIIEIRFFLRGKGVFFLIPLRGGKIKSNYQKL